MSTPWYLHDILHFYPDSVVILCSQEREFGNGRRMRRIPAGNEVVHGYPEVVQPIEGTL